MASSGKREDSNKSASSSSAVGTPAPHRRTPFTPANNNLSEDELLVKSFADIVQIKVDSGRLRALSGNDRRLIQDAVRPGMYWGLGVGLVQFALLRRAPIMIMNHILKNHAREGMNVSSLGKQGMLFPRTNADGKFKEGLSVKSFTLLMDAGLSFVTGFCVMLYATDKKAIYRNVSVIPLSEGRSDVSDALCSDFIAQHRRIPPQVWEKNTDDAVVTIARFVENCKKRTAYEQQVRNMSGLPDDKPVDIPSPGVPRILFEDQGEDMEIMNGDAQGENSFEDISDNADWAFLDDIDDVTEEQDKKLWWYDGTKDA